MKPLKELLIKRFTCLKCAECCGAWNLPIENELYQKLFSNQSVKTLLQQTNTDFKTLNDQIYLPKINNICIFLNNNDGKCFLHSELGYDNKPLECKRFPFALAEDKNGTLYIDTSFYCKAIVNNQGELTENLLQQDFFKDFDRFKFPDLIKLHPHTKTDIQTLQEYTDTIIQYLYESFEQNDIETWEIPITKALIGLCNLKNQSPEELINNINLKNLSIKGIKRFNHLFTALLIRKNNPLTDTIQLIRLKSTVKLPIIAENIDLEMIKQVKINSCQENKNYLARYLFDVLNRKILPAHGHSFNGVYELMQASFLLVIFYAKVFALLDETKLADNFHFELSIRLVERYYTGHNVTFTELFRQDKINRLIKIAKAFI